MKTILTSTLLLCAIALQAAPIRYNQFTTNASPGTIGGNWRFSGSVTTDVFSVDYLYFNNFIGNLFNGTNVNGANIAPGTLTTGACDTVFYDFLMSGSGTETGSSNLLDSGYTVIATNSADGQNVSLNVSGNVTAIGYVTGSEISSSGAMSAAGDIYADGSIGMGGNLTVQGTNAVIGTNNIGNAGSSINGVGVTNGILSGTATNTTGISGYPVESGLPNVDEILKFNGSMWNYVDGNTGESTISAPTNITDAADGIVELSNTAYGSSVYLATYGDGELSLLQSVEGGGLDTTTITVIGTEPTYDGLYKDDGTGTWTNTLNDAIGIWNNVGVYGLGSPSSFQDATNSTFAAIGTFTQVGGTNTYYAQYVALPDQNAGLNVGSVVADSTVTASNVIVLDSITLGGVEQTNWPSGGIVAWGDITGKPDVLTNGHSVAVTFSNNVTSIGTNTAAYFVGNGGGLTNLSGVTGNASQWSTNPATSTVNMGATNSITNLSSLITGTVVANTNMAVLYASNATKTAVSIVTSGTSGGIGIYEAGADDTEYITRNADGNFVIGVPVAVGTNIISNVGSVLNGVGFTNGNVTGTLAGNVTGDLTGTATNTTGVRGYAVEEGPPEANEIMKFDGTNWVFGADATGSGDASQWATNVATGTVNMDGFGITNAGSLVVTGAVTMGQLTADGVELSGSTKITAEDSSVNVADDMVAEAGLTVVGLLSVSNLTATGTITGTATNTTGIAGFTVEGGEPTDAYILKYNGTTNGWYFAADDTGSGSGMTNALDTATGVRFTLPNYTGNNVLLADVPATTNQPTIVANALGHFYGTSSDTFEHQSLPVLKVTSISSTNDLLSLVSNETEVVKVDWAGNVTATAFVGTATNTTGLVGIPAVTNGLTEGYVLTYGTNQLYWKADEVGEAGALPSYALTNNQTTAVTFGSNVTAVAATDSSHLVTLAQLQAYAAASEVYYLDCSSNITGIAASGTVIQTNNASQTVPAQHTNIVDNVQVSNYWAFVTEDEFTSISSGVGQVELWCYNEGSGTLSIKAEFYILTNGVEDVEFEPSSAAQAISGTLTKYTFSVPITDYNNANGFQVMCKLKVTSETVTPNLAIVSGGIYSSHIMFNQPGSAYVRKSGDTMTGTLTVPLLSGPIEGALTNRVSYATNAGVAAYVSGVLTNPISGNITNNTTGNATTATYVTTGTLTNAVSNYVAASITSNHISAATWNLMTNDTAGAGAFDVTGANDAEGSGIITNMSLLSVVSLQIGTNAGTSGVFSNTAPFSTILQLSHLELEKDYAIYGGNARFTNASVTNLYVSNLTVSGTASLGDIAILNTVTSANVTVTGTLTAATNNVDQLTATNVVFDSGTASRLVATDADKNFTNSIAFTNMLSSITGITGTAGTNTYLRGDGSWSTPAGGADLTGSNNAGGIGIIESLLTLTATNATISTSTVAQLWVTNATWVGHMNIASNLYVTGSITGDLTGDVTGNASTATLASYVSGTLTNTVYGSNVSGTVSYATGATTATNLYRFPVDWAFALSGETNNIYTGTNFSWKWPYGFTVTNIYADVRTAPLGAPIIVRLLSGGTAFSTNTIATNSVSSTNTTFGFASMTNRAAVEAYVEQVGSSTAGAGLKITVQGYR